jgi:hypothetical protein
LKVVERKPRGYELLYEPIPVKLKALPRGTVLLVAFVLRLTVYTGVAPVTLLRKLIIATCPVGDVPICARGASDILKVALYKPENW